jgi:hypothetical protein
MTRIKVTVSTPSFSIRKRSDKRLKSTISSGIIMARKLADLMDVDVSNINDKFVLMYDKSSGKYKAYNPDEIFSAAINEPTQPGLPQEFLDYLNLNVSNKLGSLQDVNDDNVKDKYVIMYNSETQQYVLVNPDEILRASVEEESEPGLPSEFLDQLDDDLDNRIDFDAGEY